MGVPWNTDNKTTSTRTSKTHPRSVKYNSDGTINKLYVPPSVRKQAAEAALQDTDSGAGRAEATVIARATKKQNEERIENRQKRADEAMRTKNKRAKRAGSFEESQKAMKDSFAPYQDSVRKEKDKAEKKMKEMQKRSYYEDL